MKSRNKEKYGKIKAKKYATKRAVYDKIYLYMFCDESLFQHGKIRT